MEYKFADEMFLVSTKTGNTSKLKSKVHKSVQNTEIIQSNKQNNIRLKLKRFRALRLKLKK